MGVQSYYGGSSDPRPVSDPNAKKFLIGLWVLSIVTVILLIVSAFVGMITFIIAIVTAILAVICLARYLSKNGHNRGDSVALLVVPIVLMVIFGGIFTIGSIEKVDTGEVGVVTTSPNSSMIGSTLDVGWNFNPIYMTSNIDTIRYNTRTVEYVGSDSAEDTMGGITIKTSEGLDTNIDMAITFHLNRADVSKLRVQYGQDWMSTLIEQPMRSIPRTIGSDYTVEEIYGEKRSEFESKILESIKSKVSANGIVIEDLAIREVRLPDSVMEKINAKIAAEQDKLKAEIDKVTKQTNAEAEAIAKEKSAEGEAKAIETKADAEAYQIEKQADAEAAAYVAKIKSFLKDPDNYTTEEWNAAVEAYLTWVKFNDASVVVTDGNTVVVTA